MKVYLRAFEPEDYKLISKWRNIDSLQALTGGPKFFVSSERDKKWIEEKIYNNTTEQYCAICLKENNTMIGYLALSLIDLRNRSACWYAILIGNDKYRNLKLSTDACYLMLSYAFEQLGLNRVYGYFLEENKGSLMLSKTLGFKEEGLLRNAVFKNGKFHNQYICSLLKEEFDILKTKRKSFEENF